MKNLVHATATLILAVSAPAFADDTLELAKSKQCLNCHGVDQDSRAPSFKHIAAKYRDHDSRKTERLLKTTIMRGSSDTGAYHWGPRTMPGPNQRLGLNDTEARQLVRWILSQK